MAGVTIPDLDNLSIEAPLLLVPLRPEPFIPVPVSITAEALLLRDAVLGITREARRGAIHIPYLREAAVHRATKEVHLYFPEVAIIRLPIVEAVQGVLRRLVLRRIQVAVLRQALSEAVAAVAAVAAAAVVVAAVVK